MFAVECPYCQRRNERGARFCAECGAPLHLRPCASCGKVDDVTAKQCTACGTPFAPIELAEFGAAEEPGSAGPAASAIAAGSGKPHYRAGPLIAVAIVAGGLPIFWINRAHMPLPKAWQMEGPNATGSAAMPQPIPAPAPVVVPATRPAPQAERPPAPTPNAARPAEPEPALRAEPAVTGDAQAQPAEGKGSKASARAESAREKARKPPRKTADDQRKPQAEQAPQEAVVPTRQCTQALVALGLCKESELK